MFSLGFDIFYKTSSLFATVFEKQLEKNAAAVQILNQPLLNIPAVTLFSIGIVSLEFKPELKLVAHASVVIDIKQMFFEISAGLRASGSLQVSTPCFFVIKISLGIQVIGKVFENGIAVGVFSKDPSQMLFSGEVCGELRHIRHAFELIVRPSCEICTGWFCGHCRPCLQGLFDKLTYINIFGMPTHETLASTCTDSFAFAIQPPPPPLAPLAPPRPHMPPPRPPSHLPILDESLLCSNPFTYVPSCISSCTEWSQCHAYANFEDEYKFCAHHGHEINCEPCFEICDSRSTPAPAPVPVPVPVPVPDSIPVVVPTQVSSFPPQAPASTETQQPPLAPEFVAVPQTNPPQEPPKQPTKTPPNEPPTEPSNIIMTSPMQPPNEPPMKPETPTMPIIRKPVPEDPLDVVQENQYVTIFIPGLRVEVPTIRRSLLDVNQTMDDLLETMSGCVTNVTTTEHYETTYETVIDMSNISSEITSVQVFPNGTYITLHVSEATTRFTTILKRIVSTETFTRCVCTSQTCQPTASMGVSEESHTNALLNVTWTILPGCILIVAFAFFMKRKRGQPMHTQVGEPIVEEAQCSKSMFVVDFQTLFAEPEKPYVEVKNPMFTIEALPQQDMDHVLEIIPPDNERETYLEIYNPSYNVNVTGVAKTSSVQINPLLGDKEEDNAFDENKILSQIASLKKVHRASINQSESLIAKLRAARRWKLIKMAIISNTLT